MFILAIILSLLFPTCSQQAEAAVIQYKLSNMEVVGATDAPIEDVYTGTEFGVAHIQGRARDIVWPIPATGCSHGALLWSRVASLSPLTLALRPGIVIYNCTIVESRNDVERTFRAARKERFLDTLDAHDSGIQTLRNEADQINTREGW